MFQEKSGCDLCRKEIISTNKAKQDNTTISSSCEHDAQHKVVTLQIQQDLEKLKMLLTAFYGIMYSCTRFTFISVFLRKAITVTSESVKVLQ